VIEVEEGEVFLKRKSTDIEEVGDKNPLKLNLNP